MSQTAHGAPEERRRGLDDVRLQQMAESAGHAAVREMMLRFGVDVDDAASLRSFNADQQYLHQQREASEKLGASIRVALIGTVIAGGFAFFGWAIKTAIGFKGVG